MRSKRPSILFIAFLALLISLFRFSTLAANAEELVITGNGDGSESTINAQSSNTTSVAQSNNANTSNNVDSNANTGSNQIANSNADSSVATGNVNSNTTVANTGNVSEVNNTCCPTPANNGIEIRVQDNGSDSSNKVNIGVTSNQNVTVSQQANVNNDLNGKANTGENKIKNSIGNSNIDTGNIYASVLLSNDPINIYKATIGNAAPQVSVLTSGNGADTDNLVTVLIHNLSQITANNTANINNDLNWHLNTGKNTIGGNTNGVANIKTGDVFLDVLLQNNLNQGEVIVSCCQTIPTPPGGGDGEHPGGGGENNGGGSGGSSSGSNSNSQSSTTTSSSPSVLGLSNTAGLFDNPVNFWIGMILLTFGISLVGKNITSKSLRTNEIR